MQLALGLGLVELGELLMEMANRRIARLGCHLPALFGTFQMERPILLDAHHPSPLGIQLPSPAWIA